MAVDFLGYAKLNEGLAIQEAASEGLKSMEHLIRSVSHQQQYLNNQQLDCREITDFTVSKFRKVISILDRTGHARFRRSPGQNQPQSPPLTANPAPVVSVSIQQQNPASAVFHLKSKPSTLTLDFTNPSASFKTEKSEVLVKDGFVTSAAVSTSGNSSSTFLSSITGEGSVSNGKSGFSAGKPPLAGKRCREHEHSDRISGKTSGSNRCHCKKRKSKVKRTIRVPAISSKVADIPSDEYSWRKYGQKPIKGSPYPRGYYKCSTVKECPARKHVERATDDPTMLIVTYEGEHRHAQGASQEIAAPGGVAPPQMMVFEST